jgi:mannan endo-1,4-beta-mannosidase
MKLILFTDHNRSATRATLFFLMLATTSIVRAEGPGNLKVLPGTITGNSVSIFWDKPRDYQSVKSYEISCNGLVVGKTTKNNFKVVKLSPERTYSISVAARYASGRSEGSKVLKATTQRAPKLLNVLDFGAKGDGISLNTKSLQSAIDACPAYGEVLIPAGLYITGGLFVLKNNITIRLAKGSVLKASHNLGDFPLVNTRFEGRAKQAYSSVLNIGTMDGSVRYKNIRLVGEGTIDGQGSFLADKQTAARDRMARAHGLPVINCDDVAVEGITIQNPCTWLVHPIYCNGFTTDGVTLLSDGMGLSNADGWDPDSSTECYLINSTLETHDDHVAIKSGVDAEGRAVGKPSENIYISYCHFRHGGGIAVGSEMSGGVRNVWFTDCTIENSDRGFHVKSRPGRGGLVENINFRNITVEKSGGWGISVDMWYYVENHISGERKQEEIPVFRNITFENIHIKKAGGNPIQVIGLPESLISNVTFRNVTVDQSEHKVLLRNCEKIRFKNVRLGDKLWIEDNTRDIKTDSKTEVRKTYSFPFKLVDDHATYATKALFANLKKLPESDKFLFGQQDATASGYGWKDESGRSDIYDITGKMPAVYGWDYMDFTRPNTDNSKDEKKIRKLTCKAFYNGGVNTYCWHFWNPVTNGSFYDTSVVVVSKLLPGGSHHENYKRMLKRIADYNKTLIGRNGEQIPVIFRPFHEMDGNWFWWGATHCTAEEYKALYRFTVTYLRDVLGVRNFIYAFSPDCKYETEEQYMARYPGDEYVDVVATDNYWDFRADRNDLDLAYRKLKIVSDYASSHGKLAALTETGQSKLENPKWFTEALLKVMNGYPKKLKLAYIAVWRNSEKGYYTPYKGHPAVDDFKKFVKDEHVIMGDNPLLKSIYELE